MLNERPACLVHAGRLAYSTMSNRCGGPADCANVHVVYSEVIVVRARQTTMFDLSDDSVFSDKTEQSVFFVANAGSEIHAGLRGSHKGKKIPQAIDLEWSSIVTNRSQKGAVCRIVVIDLPVAKVSNPKLAGLR